MDSTGSDFDFAEHGRQHERCAKSKTKG